MVAGLFATTELLGFTNIYQDHDEQAVAPTSISSGDDISIFSPTSTVEGYAGENILDLTPTPSSTFTHTPTQTQTITSTLTFTSTMTLTSTSLPTATQPPPTPKPAQIKNGIVGRVYWEVNGSPIPNVGLALGSKEVTTNANGYYTIKGLDPGSYSFNLLWVFNSGDVPCSNLNEQIIKGQWFTTFVDLNAGGNMVLSIQEDVVQIIGGQQTTFDIVFRCG